MKASMRTMTMAALALLLVAAVVLMASGASAAKGAKTAKLAAKMAMQQHIDSSSSSESRDTRSHADLAACLDDLKASVRDEAIAEQARDECMAELAPLIVEDAAYKRYRDHNHTDAITCLLGLTECNNANEEREEGLITRRRRALDSDVVDHPYFGAEENARSAIRAHDAKTYARLVADITASAAAAVQGRARRDCADCSLKRCESLVRKSNFTVGQLRESTEWCRAEVVHRKASIMAYYRFSVLFEQEASACAPLLANCTAGLRRVRVTLTNGEVGDVPYYSTIYPGWVGFTNYSITDLAADDYASFIAALMALATSGDAAPLSAMLGSYAVYPISSAYGNTSSLGNAQSWQVVFDIDPRFNNYAYIVMPLNQGGATITFLVPEGVRIFDGENFIVYDSTQPTRRAADDAGRVKRAKRLSPSQIKQLNEDCGCVGDEIPTFNPHEHTTTPGRIFNLNGGALTPDEVADDVAQLTIEELRYSVPYPPAIRPEYRDEPSPYGVPSEVL